MTVEFIVIQNDPSFDHEEVVHINTPAGTIIKRGSMVTVSINYLEGII
ncbi:hypothetical protein ACQKM9_16975 [Viridibacillus sp. NPDC093762]